MAKIPAVCLLLEILHIYLSDIVVVSAQTETGESAETTEPEVYIQCFGCSNYNGSNPNPDCLADGTFNYDNILFVDCTGPCYTKGDAADDRVVTRGCVRELKSIPATLPSQGCYDWQGASICLCYMDYCNLEPLGQSSGTALDPDSAPDPVKPTVGSTTSSTTITTTTTDPSTTTTTITAPTSTTTVATTQRTTTAAATTLSTATTIVTTASVTTTRIPTPVPPTVTSLNTLTATTTTPTLTTSNTATKTTTTVPTTPTTTTTTTTETPILAECFDCSSFDGDSLNPDCPIDGSLNFNDVPVIACRAPCFTRNDVFDNRLVQRGCSSSLESLPSSLPPEGCYRWQGASICLCYTTFCNIEPVGNSNVPLDSGEEQRELMCIDCSSDVDGVPNTNCPFNGRVLPSAPRKTCSTFCYSRTVLEQSLIVRGCTSDMQGLPAVMPPADCYSWDEATFCICSNHFCNVNAIGPSNGKSLDYLEQQIAQNITTRAPVGSLNTTASTPPTAGKPETIHCIECTNYIDGALNPKCPFSGPVTREMSSMKECQDPCYYRTVASDAKLIFRGCSTHLQGLPSKLPPPGCYEWEGAVFCTCSSPLCNTVNIGTSTGKSLDYLVNPAATTKKPPTQVTTTTAEVTAPVMGDNFTIQCFDCLSFLDNKDNKFCPPDGPVDVAMTYLGKCAGPCFTRRQARDNSVVVRGCTVTQGTLPNPLPAEGCYDWEGTTFCVCYTSGCNRATIGKSKGVSLDDHIISGNPGPSRGPLQCFECLNFNPDGTPVPQCPKNGRVNVQTVYSGNCSGACFTRTFSDNSTKIARGCTTSQYGFPQPLPPSGCYSYKAGETWCLCNTSQCNGGPIGVSSGTELDAHLYEIGNDFVEPDGINRCYQCLSYYQNVYYPQCPRNGRVRNAYLAPCNGSCFTRTYDKDDRIIARGCTDYLHGLPEPLPPDGCYRWYTEIWCVCSNSRCNGAPLGTPLDIEFDAHIQIKGRGSSSKNNLDGRALPFLTLILLLRWCLVI